jgi:hypothetical protein
MRKEANYPDATMDGTQSTADNNSVEAAFAYLKSLPKNLDRAAVRSYPGDRTSAVIDHEIAESFTDRFRGASTSFDIPVSWTMTKASLKSLLGITDSDGAAAVVGIRFYAGINCDNQLTLIAVSTMAGSDCPDDLTIAESYPYYDFADPCPTSCSSRGNLKSSSNIPLTVSVVTE